MAVARQLVTTYQVWLDQVLREHIGIASFELRLMQTAMQRAKGNLSQAARLLGITRPQLAYRLKKEGLPEA